MTETPAISDPLASLPIPPFSPSIFTDDLTLPDDYLSFDYQDLGITFDDEHNPSHNEEIFNSTFNQSGIFDPPFSVSEFNDFVADLETIVPESGDSSGNHGLDASGSLNIPSLDDFGETVKSMRISNNYSSESRNENPVSIAEFNDFVSDLETIVPESGDLSGNLSGNHGLDASGSLNLPSPDEFDETVKSTRILNNYSSESRNENPVSMSEFNDFVSDLETIVPESGDSSGNLSGNLSGNHGLDASGYMNIPSPDDFDETVESRKILNNYSSESRNENPVSSQGSGNCGSVGSEADRISPSHDSGNSVVNRKMTGETDSNSMLKRKKESCDVNLESRTMKHRKSNESSTAATEVTNRINEEDEKKKARLIRNRESAQLSRQRRKQYVEELEVKIKAMHATIQDLNARITYITAENATLKQQMVAAAGSGGGGAPVMCPPHPAMQPMGYPWIPFPPYAFKSQGSQVPLLPIPRLTKTQCKKDVNKTEGKSKTKTKKVASISFIGLLLFVMLFGGLVPIMNVKFGGLSSNYPLSSNYNDKFKDYKLYNQQHHGRVLMGDENVNRTNYNSSEPLVASLYVPRNNKLVKIDGSLIISSVLASEKAMESRVQQRMTENEDTGLAVVPAISIPIVKRIQSDGKPQQWFRERLSGLMLSSGMCTEVFQFDASVTPGAIVAATSAVNVTAAETRDNATYITTVKNRRILHGLPVTNITKEQVAGHDSKHRTATATNRFHQWWFRCWLTLGKREMARTWMAA